MWKPWWRGEAEAATGGNRSESTHLIRGRKRKVKGLVEPRTCKWVIEKVTLIPGFSPAVCNGKKNAEKLKNRTVPLKKAGKSPRQFSEEIKM